MRGTFSKTVLIGLSMLAGISAAAESLTSDMVGRFIESMNGMQEIADRYEDIGESNDGFNPRAMDKAAMDEIAQRAMTPFSSGLSEMQAHEGYGDLLDMIEEHGFDSAEQWAQVGDRVMRAYAALQMTAEMPNMNAEMAQAMKELESSGMSEEQKQMMRGMLQSSTQVVSAFNDVPEADKAAVKPHIAAIEAWGEGPPN